MTRAFMIMVFIFLSGCGGGAVEDAATTASVSSFSIQQTDSGVIFARSGLSPSIVIVLRKDMSSTMSTPDAAYLEAAGYSVVSIDLPCHGADAVIGVSGLDCWRRRVEAGDTAIFSRFIAQVRDVIAYIHPERVALMGTSRGGYIAFLVASAEPSVKAVIGLAPVTNLARLQEFDGFDPGPVFALPPIHQPALIAINHIDTRVGADSAIAYGNSIGATMQVLDGEGHDPHYTAESVLAWLSANLH